MIAIFLPLMNKNLSIMGKIIRFCVILKKILKDFELSDHRISDDSYITNLLFPVSLVEASVVN